MKRTQPQKTGHSPKSYTQIIRRNVICIFAALLVVWICYKQMPEYTWVYRSLLKGNIDIIHKYKDLTLDQKYEMKLGLDYAFLRYIRKNTPDTAIILMPEREAFFPKGQKSDFKYIYHNIWQSRFLYPRKVILLSEKNEIYMKKITHVAIVNGYGRENLNYTINNPAKYMVLPINQPHQ